jgi:hypothetical protein
MKMDYQNCRRVLITGLFLCAFSAHAFDPGEAAGTWRILNFSVPSQLTLQRNALGVVTNIPEAANFDNSTGSLTVLSNATFSGTVPDPVSGTVSAGGQGEMVLNLTGGSGPPTMTFNINRTADFMTTCGRFGPGFQDLIVGLRSPTTLTTNDLVGRWNILALDTPYQLALNRDSSNQVINIQGLGYFETYGGALTILSNGTFTGDAEGTFTGLVTSASSGLVNVTVTNANLEVSSISLFVNASKDVMAYLESAYDASDNYQQIMFFQKASATNPVPVSRLAAPWRVITYDVPQLTQIKNGQGQLIGLAGLNNFYAARRGLVSGYDGFFTALVGDVATGTLSPATNGMVTMNVQTGDGPDTNGFNLNASETLLTSARSLGVDGYELLLLTKSAPVAGSVQNFGLVMIPRTNALELDWAAATNSVLQASSNLTSWNTMSNTIGQHTYTTGISNRSALFRIIQPVP